MKKNKTLKNKNIHTAPGIDPLTGICNREGFFRHTRKMLAEHPDTEYVLVRWDIERFKVINDIFGTAAGDKMLRNIAEKFPDVLPGTGTYGRIQADNFAACFPKDLFNIDILLEKMDALLAIVSNGYPVNLYAGIYYITEPELPISLMCDRAKLAIETIKGSYIRHYAVYDNTIRDKLLDEQQILSEMENALENGDFFVVYQPIFSSTTSEPVSAEALIRWKHPQKGIITPGTFIPLFEKTGFITKLDFYVWEQVCKFLHDEQEKGHRVVPVSVNISRLNFLNDTLCSKLTGLIKKYRIDTSLLKLEITESAYTDNPVQLVNVLINLQLRGFKILMDDFGSGYSSLNMLKDIPVDILKIDMNFIKEIETSERAANILNSVVRMAKWLEMDVIAEGIETREQLDFLRSIGCDWIQGFYFSQPLQADAFSKLINSYETLTEKDEYVHPEDIAKDFDLFWTANKTTNFLMNSMLGAMGIFEFEKDELELVRANEALIKLFGDTGAESFMHKRNFLDSLHTDDRPKTIGAFCAARETGDIQQVVIRGIAGEKKYVWLETKIKYIGKTACGTLYYVAMTDITFQKDFEQRYALYRYTTIFRGFFYAISELNYTDNTSTLIMYNKNSLYQKTDTIALTESTETMLGIIHPDDRPLFTEYTKLEVLKAEIAKNDKMAINIRVRRRDNEYHWTSQLYVPVNDPHGKDIFMVFTRSLDESPQDEKESLHNPETVFP